MLISIELRDRLHKELKAYCEREQTTISEFCAQLIEDAYYTAKYGDLNEIMGVEKSAKTVERTEPEPKEEAPVPTIQPQEEPEETPQPKAEDKTEQKPATITKSKRTRRKLL